MKIIALLFSSLVSTCVNSQNTGIYPCRTPCNIGVQIGDYKSGDSINKFELLKAGELNAEVEHFTILSYRIIMDGPGFCCDAPCEIVNTGDKFVEEAFPLLKRLRHGVFIGFECITAKDACGNIIALKPAVYIIRK